MKILIVDDNPTNLRLLRAILEGYNHEVVQAADGEEALQILETQPIGAVISDILMPKVDGFRLCYEVRRSEKFGDLPFVVYSSTYNSPADEKLCLDLGADKYVRKPAPTIDLLNALGEAIAAPRRKAVISLHTSDVLKEYSERLVDKLEERNFELQEKTAELEEAHEHLTSLLAHSPSITYSLNIEGPRLTPAFVSENMERILGVHPSSTDYDWWARSLHPDDRSRTIGAVQTALQCGGGTYEYRIRHRNGTYLWVQDSNRVIREDAGRPARLVGSWVDITARKMAEEALQKTLDELEQRVQRRTEDLARTNEELREAKILADSANKSKSEFLSRMSHELRTPMNSILGFGQLLEFSKLDEGQQDSVTHILKAGKHLLRLINEVLEISRIEAGAIRVSLEPVDVRDVLEECISLIGPSANDRGIAMAWANRRSQVVLADKQRLRQVLLNLLSNAVKYNVDKGSVSIRVDASEESTVIEVSDTGHGIPAEMAPRLFMPFERLGAASTTIEGTGLGLSLSKSLVEAMGGSLTLEPQEGAGCCFRVTLASSQDQNAEPTGLIAAALDPNVWAGISGKLLVIEDNLMNTQLLTRMFAGFPQIELMTTMQGRLGLQIATDNPPDAILLDLHLPDMHGKEVLSALRASEKLIDVPVIIVTADAFSDQSEAMLKAGAFRYLTKPFVLTELISAVAAAFKMS